MLAPLSHYLLFPFAAVVAFVAAVVSSVFRDKGWYLFLWLPIVLWNSLGTLAFAFSIGFLMKINGEPGEAAGFAGLGALFMTAQTILFVAGVVQSFKTRPRYDDLRVKILAPVSVCGQNHPPICGLKSPTL